MTGQAQDKAGSPETTAKEVPNSTPEVSESNQKVLEANSKDTAPDSREADRPTTEKSSAHRSDEQEAPSRHLWVGNVSTSVTEAELAEQFSRFGDIESVTAYPSRNYAFVNFKTTEDGLYAKKGLQGTVLGGLAIRIEFAKGAKPSKHLWIGNIPTSVTKEQVEAEFKRFGSLEDVRILRERNCAFVDFTKTDDAVKAFENLDKKLFGPEELSVEYVKSQAHLKRDGKLDGHPRSDERFNLQDGVSNTASSAKVISEKPRRDKDEPSEILWVGFPICMKIDERKLHKAFSPFGGIERITTFPGRTYAFVQFHSVKAATRAKNVLQGKLFNDPRVTISFAKSEIGPVDHHARETSSWMPSPVSNANLPPLLFSKPPGFANPRNDRFLGFNNFRPHSPSFRRRPESDMNDASMFFQGSHYDGGFRDDLVRGLGPGPELSMWGSPALPEGAFLHPRHAPHHMQQERWSFEEDALNRREPKRPRASGNPSARGGLIEVRSPDSRDDREGFQVVKAQDYISKVARISTSTSENREDFDGLKRPAKRPALGSDMDVPRSIEDNWRFPVTHSHEGFQWQGVISKSGTAVCRSRCYSIGKVTDFVFPEVVNCTARTSLDMLAKHISEVGEFSLVSFVPHGDLDVESYQEFIVYLSEKNRAAVCKLSQESTLFLVPPSGFVEHFLKVPNGNTIIGVVLKLQQSLPSSTEQAGSFLHMHMGLSGVPSESYQKSVSQTPLEQKLPIVTSMQAATIHGIAGTEVPLLPPRSNLQSSSSAGPNYTSTIGISSTGGLSGSLFMANNTLGHGPMIDDGQLANMHLPPGYASIQQQQQQTSAPQVDSFSLGPTTDLHAHQEHSMRISASLPISTDNQVSSTSGQYQASQMQTSHMKNGAQTSPYTQQPPLPQYPHPSTQQKQPSQSAQVSLPNVPPTHGDQFPQLASQLQPFPDNLQAAMQSQSLLGSLLQQHHLQQTAPGSNFTPMKDQWPTTQPSHPPTASQIDDNRGQTTGVDAEQRELLRLAQQKLSEAKGEPGEDSKRFQATLELAAALLQQLQQRAK